MYNTFGRCLCLLHHFLRQSFQDGPGTKLPTASNSQRLDEFRTNLGMDFEVVEQQLLDALGPTFDPKTHLVQKISQLGWYMDLRKVPQSSDSGSLTNDLHD